MAEKVLEAPQWPPEWPYTEVDFSRQDESDDAIFYDGPRLVSVLKNGLILESVFDRASICISFLLTYLSCTVVLSH